MITQAYILILRRFIQNVCVCVCAYHVQKWRTGEPSLVSHHIEMFQEVDNEIYYDKIESILPSEFERCVVPLLPLKDLSY
jgi:hypothetical protein